MSLDSERNPFVVSIMIHRAMQAHMEDGLDTEEAYLLAIKDVGVTHEKADRILHLVGAAS